MRIVDTEIGTEYPPYFIVELGSNHDGSLERGLRAIELAADVGANAFKTQHFRAETLISRKGFAEIGPLAHQAAWKKSVDEVYREAQLQLEWTEHLSAYAHDHGMAYITTAYSPELADFVEPYVDAYKIGSGDVTYHELIEHVAAKGKPVLLATGASTEREVAEAVNAVWRGNPSADLCLMQCTTDYTGEVPWESLNLAVLKYWADLSGGGIDYGFSDHTPGHAAVIAAIALGARVIEKHFTDDPARQGPDHNFALDPYEWCVMIDDAKRVYAALGNGVKEVKANEEEARVVQRRALRWKRDLYEGQTVEPEMIVATRPCPKGAMDPRVDVTIIGRQLKRDVEADDLIRIEDVA